jgi:hypothetical protein
MSYPGKEWRTFFKGDGEVLACTSLRIKQLGAPATLERIYIQKAMFISVAHTAEHDSGDQKIFRTLFRGSRSVLHAGCVTFVFFLLIVLHPL